MENYQLKIFLCPLKEIMAFRLLFFPHENLLAEGHISKMWEDIFAIIYTAVLWKQFSIFLSSEVFLFLSAQQDQCICLKTWYLSNGEYGNIWLFLHVRCWMSRAEKMLQLIQGSSLCESKARGYVTDKFKTASNRNVLNFSFWGWEWAEQLLP